MKSHALGVFLFGLATAASLTLLYGVDLGRSWIEVSGSTAREYQVPIRRVQGREKQAVLTFDAVRESKNLEKILGILEQEQVRAAFFVTGDWAEQYPEEVRKIAASGQDLGISGRVWRDMRGLSGAEAREELKEVREQAEDVSGQEISLFRPPEGRAGHRLVESARDCGLITVAWDVDSLDWKEYGADFVVERLTGSQGIRDGSIVLCRADAKDTAEALEDLIREIRGKGYELVGMWELLYREDFYIDQQGTQISWAPEEEQGKKP